MAGGPPTTGQRFLKELRQNWWLWGSVIFAILLVGGLLLFRNQLYDSATHGLPFLAGTPSHFPAHSLFSCIQACQIISAPSVRAAEQGFLVLYPA